MSKVFEIANKYGELMMLCMDPIAGKMQGITWERRACCEKTLATCTVVSRDGTVTPALKPGDQYHKMTVRCLRDNHLEKHPQWDYRPRQDNGIYAGDEGIKSF